jgi:hypothetical protein
MTSQKDIIAVLVFALIITGVIVLEPKVQAFLLSNKSVAACEASVLERVKSPSTAIFSDQSTIKTNSISFTVTAHVDAQNSYGAIIRSNIVCEILCISTGCRSISTTID